MPHTVEPLEPRVLLNSHPTVLSVQINDGLAQRSMVTNITVQFSSNVSASLGSDDLRLRNLNTNEMIAPADMAVDYDVTNQTARFTFPGLTSTGRSLANGNHAAMLVASGITDDSGQQLDGNGDGAGGDSYLFEFFRWFGDLDGDRDVGPTDLLGLRDTWDRTGADAQYNPALDSDGDGDVGVLDLLTFRETFDTRLEPPPPEPRPVFTFGSQGTADDEFDTPTDLAVHNGQLYVVDSRNDRIKIFELTDGDRCPSGTDEVVTDEVCFDEDFGTSGSSDGRFNLPTRSGHRSRQRRYLRGGFWQQPGPAVPSGRGLRQPGIRHFGS